MGVFVAHGAAFVPAFGHWFKDTYARPRWAQMVVFTPTVRAAGEIRRELAKHGMGMLPLVVPLGGSEALAERIGMAWPAVCDAWTGRSELARWLDAQEPLAVRTWKRVEDLWQVLNRLALHGIDGRDLRRGLPEDMLGFWEVQAELLLAAMAHMQAWLKARKEVLPGEAERLVVGKAAQVLDGKDVVVAGVVDAPAPVVAMVKALGAEVVVPEAVGGFEVLVKGWVEACGAEVKGVVGEVSEVEPAEEIVAEDGWGEARDVALAVREAVARGDRRVAVVSPLRGFAAMVRAELAALGIMATDSAAGCLAETPAGRAVLGDLTTVVERLGDGVALPVEWRLKLLGHVEDARVRLALARVDTVKVAVRVGVYAAMVRCALEEAAGGGHEATPGVWILGALEARMLAYDTVIVCNIVEGVWPGAGGDGWLSEAHLRAVGLPDGQRKALLAAAEWEGLVHGGSRRVIVSRALKDGEKLLVASRFAGGEALKRRAGVPVWGGGEQVEKLGCFRPAGAMWPKVWSASFVEDMMACPYRAMGRRVLGLEPLDPLAPEPDARVGGLLAHRWLELAGKEIKAVDEAGAAAAVARMVALGEQVLGEADAVAAALWRPRFAKLAQALVARWVALGREVAEVETRREKPVGAAVVRARFDRVEAGAGGPVIVDYKTTTPPSWASVAQGTKPQLALEAWLMEAAAEVEFWHLKGYGPEPVRVLAPAAKAMDAMMAPVAGGVARLVGTFSEGQDFPAVPDRSGGGLLATGVCENCALAGVCRRQAAA